MGECEYCKTTPYYKTDIVGKKIKTNDFKQTYGYRNRLATTDNVFGEYLNLFILKGIGDKKAGLMIDTGNGARYIDINYCPFCGRKLGDDKNDKS